MKQSFGTAPNGIEAFLYTISCDGLTAKVSDYGAALVSLMVPDREGRLADVVLGYDDVTGYREGSCFLGATVGRSCNRLGGAAFTINGTDYRIPANENRNNLHSGPDYFHTRIWRVQESLENKIVFFLHSPDGDQGYPGNADITVTYELDETGGLHIIFDAVSDKDTVFNMTNHAYFNLAGQDKPEKAGQQILWLGGAHFCPDDAANIPTGEERNVEGTPMDFRTPKSVCRDINMDYEPLKLQGGYDHNWEVIGSPCAVLTDEGSGRTLSVSTDCPGIQFYAGNYLEGTGKGGTVYGKHAGVALEAQFYPDALHKPQWKQPVVKAGERYHSETVYRFGVN